MTAVGCDGERVGRNLDAVRTSWGRTLLLSNHRWQRDTYETWDLSAEDGTPLKMSASNRGFTQAVLLLIAHDGDHLYHLENEQFTGKTCDLLNITYVE